EWVPVNTAATSNDPDAEPKLVLIESPYAGDIDRNVRYAKACMRDSLSRGEAPYASHLLYTQVLDDAAPEQRRQGIEAGFAWGRHAELVAFYVDFGMSSGMTLGLERALRSGAIV